MSDAAITVSGVQKIYGSGAHAVTALEEMDLEIRDQEFFTLLGPSGCGKTTLLRMIGGFEHPSSGQISLYGQPLKGLEPDERPVNTVFQHYSLFPHMTIFDNVAFGLRMKGDSDGNIRRVVDEMLALVQMSDFAGRKPAQLSGGQQQRVALARALAPRPKVLLLDEPLSALDLKLRQTMRSELKKLQKQLGITFVFVTHDQEEAMSMSDRIAVMSKGRLQQLDKPSQIYEQPTNQFVANFIGDVNLLNARITAIDGETAVCQTGGVALDVAVRGQRQVGDSIHLAVRPEKLTLDNRSPQALTGTVIDSMYFGTDTFLHVQVDPENDPETVLEIRCQNTHQSAAIPTVGQTASIGVPVGAAVMLED